MKVSWLFGVALRREAPSRLMLRWLIANFKTWRIMHTDYRRPLATFPETISAVVALHFYATA